MSGYTDLAAAVSSKYVTPALSDKNILHAQLLSADCEKFPELSDLTFQVLAAMTPDLRVAVIDERIQDAGYTPEKVGDILGAGAWYFVGLMEGQKWVDRASKGRRRGVQYPAPEYTPDCGDYAE